MPCQWEIWDRGSVQNAGFLNNCQFSRKGNQYGSESGMKIWGGSGWCLGESGIKMYLVMTDSVILKGRYLGFLRKGHYVRVSHSEVMSVHHLAGIYQCQRSKATPSSISGRPLDEFLPDCRTLSLFSSLAVVPSLVHLITNTQLATNTFLCNSFIGVFLRVNWTANLLLNKTE